MQLYKRLISPNLLQGVQGYLQIGDDTLLNTWQVIKAPRDTMWIPQGFTTMHPDDTAHAWGWYWWLKSRSRPAVLQALADLEGISGMPLQKILQLDPNFNKTKSPKRRVATFSEIYAQEKATFPPMRPMLAGSEAWKRPSQEDAVKFLTNYYKVNRLVGLVKHRAMDMFYIPQALKEPFVKFSHHFMSHGVLIELAVPTLHFGLAPRSRVNYIRATSLWYEERDSAHSSFDQFSFFLHPFKISYLERKDSREFFCQVYLKTLFSKLSTKT